MRLCDIGDHENEKQFDSVTTPKNFEVFAQHYDPLN